MEVAQAHAMAEHVTTAASALYESLALAAVSGPQSGSVAQTDLDNTEARRDKDARQWGPEPVKTFFAVVSFTVVAWADDLRATAQLLRDDIDFGPMVMARCTTEAAGRVAWLLPRGEDVTVRTRVHRGIAMRLRGARDNATNIGKLVEVEAQGRPSSNPLHQAKVDDLLAKSKYANARPAQILTEAHRLGFKTERDSKTREHIGLVDGAVPDGDDMAYEALRHIGIPMLALFYASWSAMSHSTYDALRNHFQIRDPNDRENLGGWVATSIAARISAAGVATISAVEALERFLDYYGLGVGPRVRIDGDLQVIKSLMLEAVDEGGTAG
jgi:hypothetical protein